MHPVESWIRVTKGGTTLSQTPTTGTHSSYHFAFSRDRSNFCGVTLSASVEGNAIAEVMSKKPGVKITRFPAIIRVDGVRMLEFNMDEIVDALRYAPSEYDVYDFEF